MHNKIVLHLELKIKDLVNEYFYNRKNEIKILRKHINNNKFEDIIVIGHKMKGGGKLYGFDRISEFGKQIEKAAKIQDMETIKDITGKLEDYLNRLEIVFDKDIDIKADGDENG